MKTASDALKAHLFSSSVLRPAELYEFTLPGGTYRWTSASADVTYGGNTYSASGPGLKRGRMRSTARLEVASLDVTVVPGTVLLAGTPLMQAAVRGQFDRAPLTVHRVFLDASGAVIGGMNIFSGLCVEARPGTTELLLTVRSTLALFEKLIPPRLIQPGCPYIVYDSQTCKVLPAGFTDATKTVAAGSTAQVIQLSSASTRAVPSSIITITSGALNGTQAVIASVAGVACTLTEPLTAAPAVGVTLSILRGCDKTRATCSSVFSNMLRFGGFPDVPQDKTKGE